MNYRMKTVEALTGISRNTITAWERRHALLTPTRDASGYRAYSEADVAKLRRVKSLLDQGYQIAEVISLLDEPPVLKQSTESLRKELQKRLLDLDRAGANALQPATDRLGLQERLDEIYLPILCEVGELWVQGKITIGHEHFVSAYLREEMVMMMHNIDQGPLKGPRAVCAGFPSEPHELGLLSVALRLAIEGHRITYLGADLPAADLVAVLQEKPAELVCTSIMQPRPADEVLAWARYVSSSVGNNVVVAIGGPGVAHLAGLSTDRIRFCATFADLTTALRLAS
jgi:MerR family transcriptional regulator, light-induced transcriptional regulator